MAGNVPAVCSGCGEELGDPEDEVDHPEDDSTPDDGHFKVQIRDDGEERFQCKENGQLARPIPPDDPEHPANDNPPEGEGEPKAQQEISDRQEQEVGGVYDFPEEKDQIDVLADVVTNPHYGLEEPQIREIKEWAEDYDGQMPPDTLEGIISKFEGVQKQTAGLIRKRYELKLNKWMREQSQAEEGPPIGAGARPPAAQMGTPSPSPPKNPTPSPDKKKGNQSQEEEMPPEPDIQDTGGESRSASSVREARRWNRTERRNKAMDTAMQTAAQEAADEIARELASNFGGLLSIPQTVLQRKAEKDPDWFLEKAEQLDIDVMDLMEPSEQRKKEMGDEETNDQPSVDNEVDSALEDLGGGSDPVSDEPNETTKSPTSEERDANPMSASPQDGFEMEEEALQDDEDEDAFDEIFGDDEEDDDEGDRKDEQMMQRLQEEQ